ncbi:MAG: winged helix-turn-helix transcriptional regulator [Candidatus Methanoperedenaceae archaeon]|nr:winged helix-turn-helix transcriptional regulator [Candidatus Methanoperedenaceae archaeon]
MAELDNLDVKILTHLLDNSRKSFNEIAKSCLTSVPTVNSRVNRLLELGIIKKFTIDIDNARIGITEAVLIVNATPNAINRVAEELMALEEVKELYVTSDSDTAIVSRIAGDMQRLSGIQDRIDLTGVNNIRVINVKTQFKKDTTIPLSSSSLTLTCAFCSKKVNGEAVRKKFDSKDYFFCCNTCRGEFEKRYIKLLEKA